MSSPHELISPDDMAPAKGFSHAVAAAEGRTVFVAGQIGVDHRGDLVDGDLVSQLDAALANVAAALAAAGGSPHDIVSMTMYTTAMTEYRDSLEAVGEVWRSRLGRHYPAVALLGVDQLVDPDAVIEVVTVAVIPD